MNDERATRAPVVLDPGAGRAYDMGRIQAVFKADGSETDGAYSISEWWLEPNTSGPGAHAHPEDDVFYVLEGTMSVLIGDRWIDASRRAPSWSSPAGRRTTSRTAALLAPAC